MRSALLMLFMAACAEADDSATPVLAPPAGWEVLEVECPSGETLDVEVPIQLVPPEPVQYQAWYHYKQSYVDQVGIEGGWSFATSFGVREDGTIHVVCACTSSPTRCMYDRIVVFYQQPE